MKTATTSKEKTTSDNAKWIAVAVTFVLLLSGTSYLYLENKNVKEINSQQKAEIEILLKLKKEMNDVIKEIQLEVDKQKGKNDKLDKLLANAENEIQLKEKRINKLIQDNSSLARLKKEVAELKSLKEVHLKRIKELEELVAELSKKNEVLMGDNQVLNFKLNELQGKNSQLQKKVELASVVKADNIIVLGEKKGKNGKYAKTKAKKAERFWVTYELAENKISEKGEKVICVSVTDPTGKLIKNRESGVFMNADENMEMPYTQKFAVIYSNQKQRNSTAIDLDGHQVTKGTYTFQFYCDGYYSGVKKITLK